jgi:hypothetical protein
MTPYHGSEREVLDFVRCASAYMDGGRIRRFVRDDRASLLSEGRALWLRLDEDCRRVEREIATLVERTGKRHAHDRAETLTQELHAGQCQLQRLSTVLDDLRASAPRPASRRRAAVR